MFIYHFETKNYNSDTNTKTKARTIISYSRSIIVLRIVISQGLEISGLCKEIESDQEPLLIYPSPSHFSNLVILYQVFYITVSQRQHSTQVHLHQYVPRMCLTIHYLCACSHFTTLSSRASKLEYCPIGRVNPLRCNRMVVKNKERDPYWIRRDCADCQDRRARMRVDVRDRADALRREFGIKQSPRGTPRNRCEWMDC